MAQYPCTIAEDDISVLAKECLDNGAKNISIPHLKAIALAKIAYVSDVFFLCERYGCKIFVSMVDQDAPKTTTEGLRKDYAYLFERFFYFLEDQATETGKRHQGVIVFDELEKSKSHILIDQAQRYFTDTATGRSRASQIVPEPFFIHSDLTTASRLPTLWPTACPGDFVCPG